MVFRAIDEEEGEVVESMYMDIRLCLSIGMNPCWVTPILSSLEGWSEDESLAFGDGVEDDDEFFSLFFNVEFQKFLISLSVRPGKRAAIWDHL